MGRKKIEIKPISNERNRLVTFAKRKQGLLRKAYELSTLCKCEIAIIVISKSERIYQYGSSDLRAILSRFTMADKTHESLTNADLEKNIKKKAKKDMIEETSSTSTIPEPKNNDLGMRVIHAVPSSDSVQEQCLHYPYVIYHPPLVNKQDEIVSEVTEVQIPKARGRSKIKPLSQEKFTLFSNIHTEGVPNTLADIPTADILDTKNELSNDLNTPHFDATATEVPRTRTGLMNLNLHPLAKPNLLASSPRSKRSLTNTSNDIIEKLDSPNHQSVLNSNSLKHGKLDPSLDKGNANITQGQSRTLKKMKLNT